MTSHANSSPPAPLEPHTLQALLSDLICRWNGEKPLGRLFQTTTNHYYYDSATNLIFGCEPADTEFLSLLQNKGPDAALSEFPARVGVSPALAVLSRLRSVMDSENILSVTRAAAFGLSEHYRDYRTVIATSCRVMVLDVTEACNLRCRYCVYDRAAVTGRRSHGTRHMPWDIARRAIDCLEAHSSALKTVSITFYGGEPLLNLSTIVRAVEYALHTVRGRQLDFNISTNGTLITGDIAHFLHSHDFGIALSLDGPKRIHDEFRVDPTGSGSYSRARRGMDLLLAAYGEEAARRKIALTMVYTPPFGRERLDALRRWKENDPAIRHLPVHITYPTIGSLPCEPDEIVTENESARTWSEQDLRSRWACGQEASSIAAGWIAGRYDSFKSRPVFSQPPFQFHLNGCCLPGAYRVCVSVDGTLRVCERIDRDAPTIGSVFDGFDVETIKRVYIDDYDRFSLPDCSTCWAIRLCRLCYAHAISIGGFDAKRKAAHCQAQRNSCAWLLESFCSLRETRSDAFAKDSGGSHSPEVSDCRQTKMT